MRTGAIGCVLIGDTALLTAALYLSGGALNPFVSLYGVQVTLADDDVQLSVHLDLGLLLGVEQHPVARLHGTDQ